MNKRLIYIILTVIIIWLIALTFRNVDSSSNNNTTNINEYNVSGFSTDFTKIIDENRSSIVTINADNTISSGFVYRQDNNDVYVVSSYHGITNANNISVILDSSYSVNATLVGYDYLGDIAILKLSSPYMINGLKIGDSTLLKEGEFVISVGTPLSLDYAASAQLAMISKGNLTIENSITYNNEQYNYYLDVIQLSSNLPKGYSGSPILNMNGEVVGMNIMDLNNELNFALTVNELRIVADKIINNEEINKHQFGIKGKYIVNMPNYEKTNLNLDIEIISGIYVQKVKENSLAMLAGVKAGDILTKINDDIITTLDDYLNVSYKQAENIVFEVIRNNQITTLGVVHD